MDYENFKESFTEAFQEDLYGKGIEARFDMKSVEKLNNEGYDAVTITPADSNIGVTLNGIESELTEEEAELLAIFNQLRTPELKKDLK